MLLRLLYFVYLITLIATSISLRRTSSLSISSYDMTPQAVDVAQRTGLDIARQRLHQTAVEILRASKNTSSAIMNSAQAASGMNQYMVRHFFYYLLHHLHLLHLHHLRYLLLHLLFHLFHYLFHHLILHSLLHYLLCPSSTATTI